MLFRWIADRFFGLSDYMEWMPINQEELLTLISDAVLKMDHRAVRLWTLIRIPPVKWMLHPWGDQGGGFWVVGMLGMQVVWYNDIEDGFNLSRFYLPGVISE